MSASTAATYICTAPTCATTIITFEPCALNAETQHFIRGLIKNSYFVDIPERGIVGESSRHRGVKERVTLWTTLMKYQLQRPDWRSTFPNAGLDLAIALFRIRQKL
jgi:hypothetical protein